MNRKIFCILVFCKGLFGAAFAEFVEYKHKQSLFSEFQEALLVLNILYAGYKRCTVTPVVLEELVKNFSYIKDIYHTALVRARNPSLYVQTTYDSHSLMQSIDAINNMYGIYDHYALLLEGVYQSKLDPSFIQILDSVRAKARTAASLSFARLSSFSKEVWNLYSFMKKGKRTRVRRGIYDLVNDIDEFLKSFSTKFLYMPSLKLFLYFEAFHKEFCVYQLIFYEKMRDFWKESDALRAKVYADAYREFYQKFSEKYQKELVKVAVNSSTHEFIFTSESLPLPESLFI